MPVRLRLVPILTIIFALAACSERSGAVAMPAPLPTAQLVAQPTLQPIGPRPTRTPTPSTHSAGSAQAAAPTQSPLIATSQPTAAPQPTAAQPTATASPAAMATPAPASATTADRRYVFPVQSDGKISYGKFHHNYPATDIFCPVGSVFVAVTDGVIDFVSREDTWDPQVNAGATRGGLSVAIVGDDGVRYYGSHLSRVADTIAPGTRVSAGQELGRTGHSGDARFTDPHLHFGISHPTTPDDWAVRRGEIPPYEYLKAWEHGENVTPVLPSMRR